MIYTKQTSVYPKACFNLIVKSEAVAAATCQRDTRMTNSSDFFVVVKEGEREKLRERGRKEKQRVIIFFPCATFKLLNFVLVKK